MDRRSLQLMAGLNRHGALSVAMWRGRGGPLGGTASTVRQSEGWFGSGVALCAVRRQAMTAKQDARYRIPRLLSQQHTALLLNPGSSYTLDHRPHKHPDHPQSPCSSIARRPENGQIPNFSRCAR